MKMKNNLLQFSTCLIVAFGVLIYFFPDSWHLFPTDVHAWANFDYYAIAKKFEPLSSNFFIPETYILNKQFPHDFAFPFEQAITSVDFPIHSFIMGKLFWLFQSNSPFIIYVYQGIWFAFTLYFLSKLVEWFTNHFWLSLCIALLLSCSPVYLYYVHGFLVSPLAFATVIMSSYFMFRFYLTLTSGKYLSLALILFTISGLCRMPFTIGLIAFGATYFLMDCSRKKISWQFWLKWFSGIFIIGVYFFYNSYLRTKYGSIFLGSILPVDNLEDFQNIIVEARKRWGNAYLTEALYALLISSFFVLSFMYFRDKRLRPFIHFIAFYFLGALSYSLLMFVQFKYHDYYFIDTFLVPSILCIILAVGYLSKLLSYKWLSAVLILTIIGFSWSHVNKELANRSVDKSYDNFQKSAKNINQHLTWLQHLPIQKNERILCINPYLPNAFLAVIGVEGYSVEDQSQSNILRALTWSYDYVFIQKKLFNQYLSASFPNLINQLEPVKENEDFGLYLFNPDSITNYHQLKLIAQSRTIYSSLNNDSIITSVKQENVYHGKLSCMVSGEDLTNSRWDWSANVFAEQADTTDVVLAISNKADSMIYYAIKPIFIEAYPETIVISFELPAFNIGEEYQVNSYIWNKQKAEFVIGEISGQLSK